MKKSTNSAAPAPTPAGKSPAVGATKRRIILLGNSGVGKSYIANLLSSQERIVKISMSKGDQANGANRMGEVVTSALFRSSSSGRGTGVTQEHSQVEFESFVLSDVPGLFEQDPERVAANKKAITAALANAKNAVIVYVMTPDRVPFARNCEALKVLTKSFLYQNHSLMVVVNSCPDDFIADEFAVFKQYFNKEVVACSYFHCLPMKAVATDVAAIKKDLLTTMNVTDVATTATSIEFDEEKHSRAINKRARELTANLKAVEAALAKEKEEAKKIKEENEALLAAGNSAKCLILRVALAGPCELTQVTETVTQVSQRFRHEQHSSVRNVIKAGADAKVTLASLFGLGFSGSTDTETYKHETVQTDVTITTTETARTTLNRKLERNEYIVQLIEACGVGVRGRQFMVPLSDSLHFVNKANFANYASKIYDQADKGLFINFGKAEPKIVPLKIYQPLPAWSRVVYHGRPDRYMFIRNDRRINVPWDFMNDAELYARSNCDHLADGPANWGDGGVVKVYQCNGHCDALYIPTSCNV